MIMNDNDIASKFKATIRILSIFTQIIVLNIRIQPNCQDPIFGTAALVTIKYVIGPVMRSYQLLLQLLVLC